MNCSHKFVSVGTERFCVKCGISYAEAEKQSAKGVSKPKRKTAENAKKEVKTANAD